MQARRRNRSNESGASPAIERLDQAITWVTLGTLFMVPLFFSYFNFVSVYSEPRVTLIHFAAVTIVSLWLWQTTIAWYELDGRSPNLASWDLLGWAGKNAARWTLVAVGIYVIVQVFSTLLSPLPTISFFGGDDARSGYNFYDSISMTVLLFTVAVRFRSKRQLELLAYTLAASGTIAAIYGSAQHFGWDPIGGNADNARTLGSFGNTLNFGGYLVMSIPATMGIWHIKHKRPALWMGVVALALAFQLGGVLLSGGRGPFIGAATGVGIYFAIAFFVIPRRDLLTALAMTVGAVVAAVLITSLPSPQGSVAVNRAVSLGGELSANTTASTDISGGLAGRLSIWRSTAKLATTWDVPLEEPAINSMLRPLFGVGPDLFVYSFPFVGQPQTNLAKVDHAHNFGLHTLIELGFLGFAALVAISALVIVTGFRTVMRLRSTRELSPSAILTLAFVPAVIGKLVEAQTGVPRVSDLAMMIALIGAVVAVHEYVRLAVDGSENEPIQEAATASSGSGRYAPRPVFIGSMLVGSILVTGLLLTLFVGFDVRRVSASRHLAATYDNPDIRIRTDGWHQSQAQAPERDSFTVSLFTQYFKAAEQQYGLGDIEEATRLMLVARDLLLEYEKRDPYNLDVQLGLGKTVTKMTEWGYHEYARELEERYIKIANIYPYFPSLAGTSATVMSSIGNHELAIEFADRAIATEATTQPWSKAWYAKGRSLFELGREDEAIEALLIATEKDRNSDGATFAHQLLGAIYEQRGDQAEAEKHFELGDRPLGLG